MLLDIGIGIYVTGFIGWIFGFTPDIWFFVAGVILAILPDIDSLYFYPKYHRKGVDDSYKHRDFVHYPLIYLIIGTIVFYLFGGNEWALLFFLCSFLHFFHDSMTYTWGIRWLYPFSKKYFAFFYIYTRKKALKKLIFSFSKEEQDRYVKEYGDINWIRNIYFKFHPVGIIEYLVFISAIIFLLCGGY